MSALQIIDPNTNKVWKPTAEQMYQIRAASGAGTEFTTPFLFEGAYKGASNVRRQRFAATRGSADSDLEWEREELRARSRHLIRNNPYAAGAILTLQSNIIGGKGLRVRPMVDRDILELSREQAKALNKKLLAFFTDWAMSVEADAQRTFTFAGLQHLAFRSMLESGDTFCSLPMFPRTGSRWLTHIQVTESDRISNPQDGPNGPRRACGVELDRRGATRGFWVRRSHPGEDTLRVRPQDQFRWDFFAAFGARTGRRNSWLLFERLRPDQHRGVPLFATSIEQLRQMERYTDAELAAAVVAGQFTVFVTSNDGEGLAPLNSVPFGQPFDKTDVNTSTDIGMEGGAVIDLEMGEDVKFANPSRPNSAFKPFVDALNEQMGAGTGLPFELWVKHFTSSYSASRAALLQAGKVFDMRAEMFAGGFCQPAYEAIITESVLDGLLDNDINVERYFNDMMYRNAIVRAMWLGPARGQIDPTREVKAAAMKIERGLSSLHIEVPAATGLDWEDVHEQLMEEREMRAEAGLDPGKNFPGVPTLDSTDTDPDFNPPQENV